MCIRDMCHAVPGPQFPGKTVLRPSPKGIKPRCQITSNPPTTLYLRGSGGRRARSRPPRSRRASAAAQHAAARVSTCWHRSSTTSGVPRACAVCRRRASAARHAAQQAGPRAPSPSPAPSSGRGRRVLERQREGAVDVVLGRGERDGLHLRRPARRRRRRSRTRRTRRSTRGTPSPRSRSPPRPSAGVATVSYTHLTLPTKRIV